MAFIQCERCRRQMADDAESCPHCDAPNPAVSRQGPRPEEGSPWEWRIPLALLVSGLLILATHGLAVGGVRGGVGVLVGIAVLFAVDLPFSLAALFIAAYLLDIDFGEFGPAVLKLAAVGVFAGAWFDAGARAGHPILGGVVGVGASLFLYGKLFKLTAAELLGVVLVFAVTKSLIYLAIGSMFRAAEGV
jgi:hypothetical protein